MRKVFLTTLYATAIGFSAPTAGWSQSTPVAPAANAWLVPHSSKAGSDAITRMKRAKIGRSVPIEERKKDDSWFRQTPDPCQVEG
jgi:hypothetical protein